MIKYSDSEVHMYKNPYFTLINIGKSCYLLPFGQSISDHKRGIRISSSGADIWNMLENFDSEDDLISVYLSENQISGDSTCDASSDIKAFLDQLKKLGIILSEKPHMPDIEADEGSITLEDAFQNAGFSEPLKITIAGFNLELSIDSALTDAKFASFRSGFETSADLFVCTTEKDITVSEKETILTDASEMTISGSVSYHIIRYKKNICVKDMYLQKEGHKALIRLKEGYDAKTAAEEIFHAIRIPFLMLAESKGMYAIHSASVLYKEKAWLFSAPSGTGKSTHARLWTTYSDAEDINGDLNLIGILNGIPTVFGIPWCGTSEIFSNRDYPLGGVVFLKQAPENSIEKLNFEKALVTLSRRTISPLWNSASLEKMINDLEPVSEAVTSLRLYCTKDPEAQKILQDYITN